MRLGATSSGVHASTPQVLPLDNFNYDKFQRSVIKGSLGGTIMSLRWSPSQNNSKYLAIGCDDASVHIYERDTSYKILAGVALAAPSSGFEGIQQEKYKLVKKWSNVHAGDVTAVAWSSDASMLASCAVDQHVVIYKASRTDEGTASFDVFKDLDLKVLGGCIGLLKGLAWDPLGHYLAVHPDSLEGVWFFRISDWKLEKKLKDACKIQGSTMVQRLDWSPDGQYVASSNASNKSFPVAALLERGAIMESGGASGGAFLSLVGHTDHIECIRFHPCLFKPQAASNGSDNTDGVVMYCAVGSQDRSLSIWRTGLDHPLLVLQDVFGHSVMDFAWYQNILVAVSYDGGVAFLLFQESDNLGKMFSQAEMLDRLNGMKSLVPKADVDISMAVPSKKPKLADLLLAATSKNVHESTLPPSASSQEPILASSAPLESQQSSQPSIISTVGGKKRIQPTLLTTSDPIAANGGAVLAPSKATVVEKIINVHPITENVVGYIPIPDLRPSFSVGQFFVTNNAASASATLACQSDAWTLQLSFLVSLLAVVDQYVVVSNVLAKSVKAEKHEKPQKKSLQKHASYDTAELKIYHKSSGMLAFPPWILDSSACFLSGHGSKLLCVTSLGRVHLWDLSTLESLLPSNLFLAPLLASLDKPERVLDASLTDACDPIIIMADKTRFLYHHKLNVWMKDESRLLKTIYSTLDEAVDGLRGLSRVSKSGSQEISIQQLETNVAMARLQGNRDAIMKWTLIYCQACLASDMSSPVKLEELLKLYCLPKKTSSDHVPEYLQGLVESTHPTALQDLTDPRSEFEKKLGNFLLLLIETNENFRYLLDLWY